MKPTDGSLWITLSTSYREYGNIGMESLQCLTGLYRKHLKYSLAPAGVNAPPESFNAPAGPAVARGPSGGQYRATSSGLPTATRTCCPAAEPAQSPLKPPSEHDSPEENIDQDIGDHNDDEKKIEDVDNNSNQDPGDEEKEEGDEEGYGEEVEE